MKKIGFIDFFLDEWHSNNFPTWIRDNVRAKNRAMEVAYAWAETTAPTGVDTAAWCAKNDVQELPSLEDVVAQSDYLIVFSPDHPEHHERLSRLPLMSGKPVYIDKTFSPDLASGQRMFDLAAEHGTPMFSASSLRDALELEEYLPASDRTHKIEFVATSGPGVYANYAVHQFEMIVALHGLGAKRVKSLSSAHGNLLAVDYGDGRKASFLQIPSLPFQVSLQFANGEGKHIPQVTDIFPRQIDSLLDFFESGIPPVPRAETLEIMALIEAGKKALSAYDTWVDVPSR